MTSRINARIRRNEGSMMMNGINRCSSCGARSVDGRLGWLVDGNGRGCEEQTEASTGSTTTGMLWASAEELVL